MTLDKRFGKCIASLVRHLRKIEYLDGNSLSKLKVMFPYLLITPLKRHLEIVKFNNEPSYLFTQPDFGLIENPPFELVLRLWTSHRNLQVFVGESRRLG